jgi:hypothetical protein
MTSQDGSYLLVVSGAGVLLSLLLYRKLLGETPPRSLAEEDTTL